MLTVLYTYVDTVSSKLLEFLEFYDLKTVKTISKLSFVDIIAKDSMRRNAISTIHESFIASCIHYSTLLSHFSFVPPIYSFSLRCSIFFLHLAAHSK